MIFIYGLYDPRIEIIRYVGKAKNVEKRLKQHLNPSNLKVKTHKNDWIKSLLEDKILPCVVILESVEDEYANKCERRWIDHFRNCGNDLTNGTDGGDGLNNPTEQTRQKMSTSHLGRGDSRKGKHHSEETKKRLSKFFTGSRHSEEAKRKISESSRNRDAISEETRKKISESKIGNTNPQGKKRKNTSSQYVGVSWDGARQKWETKIFVRGKKIYLGRFDNEIEAAIAYNEAALYYFGEDANINIL